LSSGQLKLRVCKELAATITEKRSVRELVILEPRKQFGWAFVSAMADGELEKVTVEGVDVAEDWSSIVLTLLSTCRWTVFVLQNTKINPFVEKVHVQQVFDDVGHGVSENKFLKSLVLKNIYGAEKGDLSKVMQSLKKNKTMTGLDLSLGLNVWDRDKVQILADVLRVNSTLKELHVCGIDKESVMTMLPVLETTHLNLLDISPTVYISTSIGMEVDGDLLQELQRVVHVNGHLAIKCYSDQTNQELLIQTNQ